MKHYVNFTLLIAFAILIASAALRFLEPFSLATTRIHIVFGTGVLLLVALHLASRLGYFARSLRQPKAADSTRPKPLRLILAPALLCGYALAACFLNWFPAPQLISLGYEAKNRAIIFRPETGAAIRPLETGALQMKRQAPGDASVLVEIEWGPAFDPKAETQLAIWAESSAGSLIETFFVSGESAYAETLEWAGAERRRVDILPIWRHQFTLASGVEPDGDIDAYSGSTPEHSFSVENYLTEDANGFYLCVELNAPRDPNAYYHSDQPADADGYTQSGIGQPSTYYSVYIDPAANKSYYLIDFVGHGGSASQPTGEVYYNATQLTTARALIEKILVRIRRTAPSP